MIYAFVLMSPGGTCCQMMNKLATPPHPGEEERSRWRCHPKLSTVTTCTRLNTQKLVFNHQCTKVSGRSSWEQAEGTASSRIIYYCGLKHPIFSKGVFDVFCETGISRFQVRKVQIECRLKSKFWHRMLEVLETLTVQFNIQHGCHTCEILSEFQEFNLHF